MALASLEIDPELGPHVVEAARLARRGVVWFVLRSWLFIATLTEWESFYNFSRPHGSLGGQTPYERLTQKTRILPLMLTIACGDGQRCRK